MKKAIILHGTGGTPESNWFRWLKRELQNKGLEVWLPALPDTARPSLRKNVNFISTHAPFQVDNDTIVIGHSSGATLALALVQELKDPIGALVTVSAFVPMPEVYNATAWEANARLFDIEFDWPRIRNGAKVRLMFHSDDDPYIPVSVAEHIAQKTEAELVVIPSQGHFNLEEGPEYSSFPLLLSQLEERRLL